MIEEQEEQQLLDEIRKMISEGKSFEFLNSEEDLYSLADVKQVNKQDEKQK